jgi:hypothetical protein
MDRFSSTSSEDIYHYKTKYAHRIIVPLLRSFCYNKYIQNPLILKCGEEDLHKFRPSGFLSTKNLKTSIINFPERRFPHFSTNRPSQFAQLMPQSGSSRPVLGGRKSSIELVNIWKAGKQQATNRETFSEQDFKEFNAYFPVFMFLAIVNDDHRNLKNLIFIGNPYIDAYAGNVKSMASFEQILTKENLLTDLLKVILKNRES